jgi:transposase
MKGKKRFVKLTKEERIWLEQGRKTGKKATFRQRCHYILLSDQGKSVSEIADIYQVVRQSVTNWYNRFESVGISGLHTMKGTGRPPIVRIDNETEVTRIEKLVEENAQNLKPVLTAIKKEFGKTMSKRTLQRILKKKMALEKIPSNLPKKTRPSRI